MNIGTCGGSERNNYIPKVIAIFTFLLVFLVIYMYYSDSSEVLQKIKNTSSAEQMIPKPQSQNRFCSFQPLLPHDAEQERLLLKSIAWPAIPSLKKSFDLKQTSHPAHSTFRILPGKEGQQWHVGDQLEIMIDINDFNGNPKKYGGDFLIAKLQNSSLNAGVAGQVVDHLNGSYSAAFPLLWEGEAKVEVILVHSSEAITVLHKLNQEQPDRIDFYSLFRSGPISEKNLCNICMRPTKKPLCNFTDLQTGEPWFCHKPKKLSCEARISHHKGDFKKRIEATKEKLFQNGENMKVSIPASGSSCVIVRAKLKDSSQVEKRGELSGPSGYYYQGLWQALHGNTVRVFSSSSAITQCLKNKMIHLYGDSTVRQWFEYLTTTLPELKEFNLHSSLQSGPFMAVDLKNNILLTFRCHGPPIRFLDVPVKELRYIANELDSLIGGENTVVIFGIWSHFSIYPVEVYLRRLQSIRRAVIRLLKRAPATVVIIRTANPKALKLFDALTNSDWYSLQHDKVLRAVFKGLKVNIVDAWGMTVAHKLPHNLHPGPPIIKNMINVILSYICPK